MRNVQEQIAQLLTQLEYPDRDRFAVRLALEEALANAVKHGNGRDQSKRFRIRCQVNTERVEIEVCDEGTGFAYDEVPSPTDADCILRSNGRGLALIDRFMDRVEYRENGSSLLMRKERSSAAG